MKVFIHAHYYLPKTLAGAEKFLHAIAIFLKDNGHEIIVSIDDDTDGYQYNGIRVVSNRRDINQYYIWADKVITHLLNSDTAINLAWYHNKPLYHLLHNNNPHPYLLSGPVNNYIIYNSEALARELALPLPFTICHPVIDVDYWANDIDHYYGRYITLVNCAVEKGGMLLQHLADAMPQHKFLGIKGGYNVQIIQVNSHRNIQFMAPQQDMRTIYNDTRIIIMPSVYESWGMVASEAMASGIPVICSNTQGLHENCGDAATYCNGQSVREFKSAIEMLDARSYYYELVIEGKKRNKTNDLNKLLQFMEKQVASQPVSRVASKEKQEAEPLQEKREINHVKEKKTIERPGVAVKKRGRPPKIKVNG
jgi:glycosyltransferase involved in cell wall biosynthesis